MDNSADLTNRNIGISYISALVGLAVILIVVRLFKRHGRNAIAKSADTTKHTVLTSFLKAEILYAPLWRFRRAEEATYFGHAINLGQLPSRPHAVCILVFLCVNIFLITWNLPWSAQATTLIPLLRNRLGSVAVANFIPIVVASSIRNPLINLLHISYDSFNLIHRWIARITILEIITHALCNILGAGIHEGWDVFRNSLKVPYVHYGLTAAIALTIVLLQSWKPIRSLAYEVFHYLHVSLVIIAFSFIWLHLKGHYQRYYLLTAVVLWGLSRAFRFVNILYRSLGVGRDSCVAYVEQTSADAVRVTLLLSRPWTFRPGQSLYLNIPQISFWASHPFSIAWADVRSQLREDIEVGEKSSSPTNQGSPPQGANQQALYLIIRRRSGMTNSLFRRIEANSGRHMKFRAFVEGPYGVTESPSPSEYGSVLLFAAGVGITHQLSFVKQIIKDCALGESVLNRVHLVWVIPTIDAVEWIQPWLPTLLDEYEHLSNTPVALRISLFVTRHDGGRGATKSRDYPQFTDVTFARPNISALISEEAEHRQGRMFVSVCANGSMADDVRANVRRLLRKRVNVDFHEEGFGW